MNCFCHVLLQDNRYLQGKYFLVLLNLTGLLLVLLCAELCLICSVVAFPIASHSEYLNSTGLVTSSTLYLYILIKEFEPFGVEGGYSDSQKSAHLVLFIHNRLFRGVIA